jgi:hypothetical protein
MSYKRVGRKVVKKGMRRPEAQIFQQVCADMGFNVGTIDGIIGTKGDSCIRELQKMLEIKVDGLFGKNSWTAFFRENPNYLIKDPVKLLQSITCGYETGALNAYGFAENDIGDNAGANYGVLQHNRLGSMKSLLKMAGRDDLLSEYNSTDKYKVNSTIASWMGSSSGIKYQDKYFIKNIYNPALKQLSYLDLQFDNSILQLRLIGLFTDTITQNGGMYSTYKGPVAVPGNYDEELYKGDSWNYLFGEWCTFEELDTKWKKYYECYKSDYDTSKAKQKANIKLMKELVHMIPDDELKMEVIAQYRARTSSYKWWSLVLARRNTFAKGHGIVYGSNIDLYSDFAIDTTTPIEMD